jgi:hypothetical protein
VGRGPEGEGYLADDDPDDAPRAQFIDDGTTYDPMPDGWPD